MTSLRDDLRQAWAAAVQNSPSASRSSSRQNVDPAAVQDSPPASRSSSRQNVDPAAVQDSPPASRSSSRQNVDPWADAEYLQPRETPPVIKGAFSTNTEIVHPPVRASGGYHGYPRPSSTSAMVASPGQLRPRNVDARYVHHAPENIARMSAEAARPPQFHFAQVQKQSPDVERMSVYQRRQYVSTLNTEIRTLTMEYRKYRSGFYELRDEVQQSQKENTRLSESLAKWEAKKEELERRWEKVESAEENTRRYRIHVKLREKTWEEKHDQLQKERLLHLARVAYDEGEGERMCYYLDEYDHHFPITQSEPGKFKVNTSKDDANNAISLLEEGDDTSGAPLNLLELLDARFRYHREQHNTQIEELKLECEARVRNCREVYKTKMQMWKEMETELRDCRKEYAEYHERAEEEIHRLKKWQQMTKEARVLDMKEMRSKERVDAQKRVVQREVELMAHYQPIIDKHKEEIKELRQELAFSSRRYDSFAETARIQLENCRISAERRVKEAQDSSVRHELDLKIKKVEKELSVAKKEGQSARIQIGRLQDYHAKDRKDLKESERKFVELWKQVKVMEKIVYKWAKNTYHLTFGYNNIFAAFRLNMHHFVFIVDMVIECIGSVEWSGEKEPCPEPLKEIRTLMLKSRKRYVNVRNQLSGHCILPHIKDISMSRELLKQIRAPRVILSGTDPQTELEPYDSGFNPHDLPRPPPLPSPIKEEGDFFGFSARIFSFTPKNAVWREICLIERNEKKLLKMLKQSHLIQKPNAANKESRGSSAIPGDECQLANTSSKTREGHSDSGPMLIADDGGTEVDHATMPACPGNIQVTPLSHENRLHLYALEGQEDEDSYDDDDDEEQGKAKQDEIDDIGRPLRPDKSSISFTSMFDESSNFSSLTPVDGHVPSRLLLLDPTETSEIDSNEQPLDNISTIDPVNTPVEMSSDHPTPTNDAPKHVEANMDINTEPESHEGSIHQETPRKPKKKMFTRVSHAFQKKKVVSSLRKRFTGKGKKEKVQARLENVDGPEKPKKKIFTRVSHAFRKKKVVSSLRKRFAGKGKKEKVPPKLQNVDGLKKPKKKIFTRVTHAFQKKKVLSSLRKKIVGEGKKEEAQPELLTGPTETHRIGPDERLRDEVSTVDPVNGPLEMSSDHTTPTNDEPKHVEANMDINTEPESHEGSIHQETPRKPKKKMFTRVSHAFRKKKVVSSLRKRFAGKGKKEKVPPKLQNVDGPKKPKKKIFTRVTHAFQKKKVFSSLKKRIVGKGKENVQPELHDVEVALTPVDGHIQSCLLLADPTKTPEVDPNEQPQHKVGTADPIKAPVKMSSDPTTSTSDAAKHVEANMNINAELQSHESMHQQTPVDGQVHSRLLLADPTETREIDPNEQLKDKVCSAGTVNAQVEMFTDHTTPTIDAPHQDKASMDTITVPNGHAGSIHQQTPVNGHAQSRLLLADPTGTPEIDPKELQKEKVSTVDLVNAPVEMSSAHTNATIDAPKYDEGGIDINAELQNHGGTHLQTPKTPKKKVLTRMAHAVQKGKVISSLRKKIVGEGKKENAKPELHNVGVASALVYGHVQSRLLMADLFKTPGVDPNEHDKVSTVDPVNAPVTMSSDHPAPRIDAPQQDEPIMGIDSEPQSHGESMHQQTPKKPKKKIFTRAVHAFQKGKVLSSLKKKFV